MNGEKWISVNERAPTSADADACRCVIAWHRYNGTMVTGYRNVGVNPFLTHWQRCPDVPGSYPEKYRRLWGMNRK